MSEGGKEVVIGRDYNGNIDYVESPHRKGRYLTGDDLPQHLIEYGADGAQEIFDSEQQLVGYLADYSSEQSSLIQTKFEPSDSDIWIRHWTPEWQVAQEITEEDKKYYDLLDNVGNAGYAFFKELSNRHIPEELKDDSLESSPLRIQLPDNESLSEMQKIFFAAFTESLAEGEKEICGLLKNKNRDEICKELVITFNLDENNFRTDGISLIRMPGGIGVAVHSTSDFNRLFPNAEQASGLYHKKRLVPPEKRQGYVGKVFFFNAERDKARRTLEHEYLHLLTENHIEPYELPGRMTVTERELKDELDKVEQELAALLEDMEFMSNAEAASAQRQKERLKSKKDALVTKLRQEVDMHSTGYNTEEAQRLFLDMRDELTAYVLSGRIVTDEAALLPQNQTWENRLLGIKHKPDREKITNQWFYLRGILENLRGSEIEPQKLFAIFATSQDLATVSKRLVLLEK